MPLLRIALIAAVCLFAGCGERTTGVEDFRLTEVTLPHGEQIKAEVVIQPQDMMRGMMFRDSLAMDRGMLFIHGSEGYFNYWMYQVKIPLDIIWMNRRHEVVEMSPNTPPCNGKSAQQCPTYGGTKKEIFVLELAGGAVAKYGIKVGDHISF